MGKPITDIECALSDVFYWEDVRNGVAPELRDVAASYLRADGEVLQATIAVLPTHYKSPQTGALLEVENPHVWVYPEGERP